jgi:hypothetical protein
MFALVKDGNFVNMFDLRSEYKNTSFPEEILDSHLPSGVVRVHPTQAPSITPYQYLEAADPVFDGTKWVAQYSVKEYSDERKGDIRDQYADNIRNMRDVKLTECDWTQAKDIPNSISSAWATYRQALRDVPSQEGFPFNVTWPNTP